MTNLKRLSLVAVGCLMAVVGLMLTACTAKAEPPMAKVLALNSLVDSVRVVVRVSAPAGAVYLTTATVAVSDSVSGQSYGSKAVALGDSAVFTVAKTLAPLERFSVKATVTGLNRSGQPGGVTTVYGGVTASDGSAEAPSAVIQITIIKGGG